MDECEPEAVDCGAGIGRGGGAVGNTDYGWEVMSRGCMGVDERHKIGEWSRECAEAAVEIGRVVERSERGSLSRGGV